MPPVASVLDRAREERRRRLSARTRTVAGLYGRAVEFLATCDDPGDMALLAHCVREILNRLPEIMGERVVGSQGARDKAVRQLVDAWQQEGLPIDDELTASASGGQAALPVPATVFDSAKLVVLHDLNGQASNIQRAHYLATGRLAAEPLDITKEPYIRLINGVRRFFQKTAHISGEDRVPLPRTEVEEQFRLVEEILDHRLGDFWSGQDVVTGLLAVANRRRDVQSGDAFGKADQ